MDATSNETSIYADEIWVWSPVAKTYEQVTSGGGGGGGGGVAEAQLSAAVAPKANSADVAAGLAQKANDLNPIFTGEATAANLTVNGNLSMTQAGTSLTVKKIQAASSSALELVNPDLSGTITGITRSTVGLASVDNASDAESP